MSRARPAPPGPAERGTRRWWIAVGAVTAVGLAVRIATVLGRPDRVPGGDAFTYHYSANALASGLGFISPWMYYIHNAHVVQQSAAFPPLFIVLLAGAAVVGFKSFFAQRIWCCIIGAAAIPLFGMAGKEISGRRVGLVAAAIAALYPNLWMDDELGLSETLSPLLVVLVLWTAYRFWRRPSWRRAAALGASVALAALGRDELILLSLLIVVPLVLLARSLPWRRRLESLGASAAAAVLVLAPWVGFNAARFSQPVFVSTGLGVTLASANCDTTYKGPLTGYWSYACAVKAPIDYHKDQSIQEQEARDYATRYIRAHEGELPRLAVLRVGRAFGFYQPTQQIHLDSLIETRPLHWAFTGLYSYYVLGGLAVVGTVVLRRRRVPVFPLWAVGLDVVISVVITFGQTRYRSTFESSIVLLAGVALVAGAERVASLRRRPSPPGDGGEAEPEPSPALAAAP